MRASESHSPTPHTLEEEGGGGRGEEGGGEGRRGEQGGKEEKGGGRGGTGEGGGGRDEYGKKLNFHMYMYTRLKYSCTRTCTCT